MFVHIHRSHERGISDLGWLHSWFSFSFAEYHNRDRMGFGALRVINDDAIKAGTGFGMHPHRDMEIITIVTKGAIEHRDSEGNHGITREGEIQYMCAGTGVHHSEHATGETDTELFQIWIFPDSHGYPPRYEQRDFRTITDQKGWHTLVSGDGRENSIRIHQDAEIRIARLKAGESLPLPPLSPDHGRLLLVVEGKLSVAGTELDRRDEMQITDTEEYTLSASEDTEVLVFEVPMER
ncbi:MAG: pirin family protein [Sulfuricurvum sp.]|jgi:hypothetical protein|uniref:pirin family protein n=1 Tax=Sulfuricurvum sp. TaxID=2025608 RepID=UPI0025FDB4BE|nr:pirin family protein [Sulfuricurvum sp.]MCK9372777.1 pirin family protein [Sulfuricurvum sp.]